MDRKIIPFFLSFSSLPPTLPPFLPSFFLLSLFFSLHIKPQAEVFLSRFTHPSCWFWKLLTLELSGTLLCLLQSSLFLALPVGQTSQTGARDSNQVHSYLFLLNLVHNPSHQTLKYSKKHDKDRYVQQIGGEMAQKTRCREMLTFHLGQIGSMKLRNIDLNFYVLEISVFISKFTETTNKIGDLKAKEGRPLYFVGVA